MDWKRFFDYIAQTALPKLFMLLGIAPGMAFSRALDAFGFVRALSPMTRLAATCAAIFAVMLVYALYPAAIAEKLPAPVRIGGYVLLAAASLVCWPFAHFFWRF